MQDDRATQQGIDTSPSLFNAIRDVLQPGYPGNGSFTAGACSAVAAGLCLKPWKLTALARRAVRACQAVPKAEAHAGRHASAARGHADTGRLQNVLSSHACARQLTPRVHDCTRVTAMQVQPNGNKICAALARVMTTFKLPSVILTTISAKT